MGARVADLGRCLTGAVNVQANLQANQLHVVDAPGGSLGVGTLHTTGLVRDQRQRGDSHGSPLTGTLLHIIGSRYANRRGWRSTPTGRRNPARSIFALRAAPRAAPVTTQAAAGLGFINFSGYIAGDFTARELTSRPALPILYTAGAQGTNIVFRDNTDGNHQPSSSHGAAKWRDHRQPAGGRSRLWHAERRPMLQVNRNAAALAGDRADHIAAYRCCRWRAGQRRH